MHIHRVVRQGWWQGTLTVVGMLVPLLAFRALFLSKHFWSVLPMSARCLAGPIGELIWKAVYMYASALNARAPSMRRVYACACTEGPNGASNRALHVTG